MATRSERDFQAAVHSYRTRFEQQAITDAQEWADVGIDCVVVDFGSLGYGLMLRRAADTIIALHSGLSIVPLDRDKGT